MAANACTLATSPAVTPARATKLRELVTNALKADDNLDSPGILWMEHLNLLVGSRADANQFYCDFLGCVPEPGGSWHVNMGSQQFHLGKAPRPGLEHVLTGSVCLAVPSLDALRKRAPAASRALGHTRFAVEDHGDLLAVTCPSGSNYLCVDASAPALSSIDVLPAGRREDGTPLPKMAAFHHGLDETLAVRARGQPGMRFLECRVRPGTAHRIGLFYEQLLQCRVTFTEGAVAVGAGPNVHLVFHEVEGHPLTDAQERAQAGPGASLADGGEGLHLCVYIERFRETFDRLSARGLVATNPRFKLLDDCDTYAQAVASRQFRFSQIVDLETGEPLLELEHEVRAVRHFQFFKRTHYPEGSGL